jgi:hypothetical protein
MTSEACGAEKSVSGRPAPSTLVRTPSLSTLHPQHSQCLLKKGEAVVIAVLLGQVGWSLAIETFQV